MLLKAWSGSCQRSSSTRWFRHAAHKPWLFPRPGAGESSQVGSLQRWCQWQIENALWFVSKYQLGIYFIPFSYKSLTSLIMLLQKHCQEHDPSRVDTDTEVKVKSKTVTLVMKEKYYRLIESQEKTIEFRSMSPYWLTRLADATHLVFQNGDLAERILHSNPSLSTDVG